MENLGDQKEEDIASNYGQEIDESVQKTVMDVVKRYCSYKEEIKKVEKPLGNITPDTVQCFRHQVQEIEQKTGYDPDQAILDSFDSEMWERQNVMSSFLVYIKDKFGPLPEIKRLTTIVKDLESKYGKEFIKGEDPSMDGEFVKKIKEMAYELQKEDYVSEDYERFKVQAAQDRLAKAEAHAKLAFKRELARQLGVGEQSILQMFRDKGLDFDQEFRRAYEQGSSKKTYFDETS
eukprot:TRINITY_DN13248_c0_g2_i1.p3 TRINITY_DN13248_c0_g2~~TRINITY_DN13248_c0_g2_i1.p3  ORF type:complete len:234 (-),score=39.33 TRINITY_DN13248_c0_g2_i1:412-1113(-)